MIVTEEFVESCRTMRGAFTRATEIILSGSVKPTQGWPRRAVGQTITEKDVLKIRESIDRRNNANIKKGRIPDAFLEAVKRKVPKPKKIKPIPIPWFDGDVNSKEFLFSYEWRTVRMHVLKRDGAKCCCCGATPQTGAVMNVDHIKPRKTHPHLALDPRNLQTLCHECNHGKGNWDSTNWRK